MSDLPTLPPTEPAPAKEETPVKDETAIPATAETSIPVTEENAKPAIEENAKPAIEENAKPATEETVIPMNEMGSGEPKDPNPFPEGEEASDEPNQSVDSIGSGLQRFIVLVNVFAGILVFFIQFWALLISSVHVDKNPTGLLTGIYLVMLAGLLLYKKLKNDVTCCCLAIYAIILGATLVVLHAWSIHVCRNSNGFCTTFHTSPETLDQSAAALCRWFTQRLFVDSLMIGCGVLIAISNGVFFFVIFVHQTTQK